MNSEESEKTGIMKYEGFKTIESLIYNKYTPEYKLDRLTREKSQQILASYFEI